MSKNALPNELSYARGASRLSDRWSQNINRVSALNWARLVGKALAGEGLGRAIGMLSGLLLVNALPKHEYGTYTIVLAIANTWEQLVNMGTAQSIVPLIGRDADNQAVLGGYLAAGLYLRALFLRRGAAIIAVFCAYLLFRQNGTLLEMLLIPLLVCITLYGQGVAACSRATLTATHSLGRLYFTSCATSLLRLLILVIVLRCVPSVLLVLVLFSAEACITGKLLLRVASAKATPPQDVPCLLVENITALTRPQRPTIIYFAFLPQIQILLLSLFGSGIAAAEIGALERLNQIVLLPGILLPSVLVPILSRATQVRFIKIFAMCILLMFTTCTLMILTAWKAPNIWLWILGQQYQSLRTELLLTVAIGCIWLVINFIDSACLSRRWVFSWSNIGLIVMTSGILVLFPLFGTISNTVGVLSLALVMALGVLGVHTARLCFGLVISSRRIANSSTVVYPERNGELLDTV